MLRKAIIGIVCLFSPQVVFSMGDDDPLLSKFTIDQFETRIGDGANPTVFEGSAWFGKDLNKFYIKTEIEHHDGETEEAEFQFLYSRAFKPNWDFQIGWRRDQKPEPTRDWLAVGFKGVAPYYIEIDTALFIGDEGRTAFRIEAEYEVMFTQKLVLIPEIEANFHGKTDVATEVGSGLSDVEIGLRLRYHLKRELAPYIGVVWTKKFGRTADFATAAGDDTSDTRFVIGIHAWF